MRISTHSNGSLIRSALVNLSLKNQQLSDPKTKHIYQKRKIDVESTFGNLKANLGFQRLSVRTQSKVECELGIALMAVNIRKLAKISVSFRSLIRKKPSNSKKMNFNGFFLKELKGYVPAPLNIQINHYFSIVKSIREINPNIKTKK